MRKSTSKSKTPKKLAAKRALVQPKRSVPQPVASTSRSSRASDSGSGDHDSSEMDFLSRPVSDTSSSNDSHSDEQPQPPNQRVSSGPKAGPSSKGNTSRPGVTPRQSQPAPKRPATTKKTPRKQAKPKRRRDRILREIRLLKNSVHLLIPMAPFQR